MQFNSERYHPKEWNIVTPSSVEFMNVSERASSQRFCAVLDGEIELDIPKHHYISSQLKLGVDVESLREQFLDGKFFIVDDMVADYRLKDDIRFVHNSESINHLMDKLGVVNEIPSLHRVNRTRSLLAQTGAIRPALRSVAESFDFNVLDQLGGEFDIRTIFSWSPFSIDIESDIQLWRLVCENGAVARTSAMNHRIPVLNDWRTNLDISREVVRRNFDNFVAPRLNAMPTERCSLDHVARLDTLLNRISADKQALPETIRSANAISTALEPILTPDVLALPSHMRQQIKAPVSAFDAMNIATEMSTHHTDGLDGAQKGALNAFVNDLIFTNEGRGRIHSEKTMFIDSDTFGDVNRAFFGETCH